MSLRTLSAVGLLFFSHLHGVATSPTASSEASKMLGRDVFEAAFGPSADWPATMAADLFPPGTLFNGKPVDDSIVFSYGPWDVNETQKEIIKRGIDSLGLPADTVEKRDNTPAFIRLSCFNDGTWIPQNQLIAATSGLDNFCFEAGKNIQGKAQSTYAMSKGWWFDSYSQSWQQFHIADGNTPHNVYFEVSQWHEWFDGYWCGEMFRSIIEGCKGSNPDTAGGEYHWVGQGSCGDNCDWPCQRDPRTDPHTPGTCRPPAAPWFTDNYLGKLQPWR